MQVKQLGREDEHYFEALHLALGGVANASARARRRRGDEFLSDCEGRSLGADLLMASFDGEGLCGSCLALRAPGRAALLLTPTSMRTDRERRGIALALVAACREAKKSDLALLQVLLPPRDETMSAMAREAGFRFLTRLRYLERPIESREHDSRTALDLDWVPFSPEAAGIFRQAVESSYSASRDCPELNGLRTTEEVLEGHRSAGDFDPDLWTVALRGQEPVGVLLLVGIPRHRAIEIAYMGVAQVARGAGVANSLLAQAVTTVEQSSAKFLTLAADERNQPALRLYERWGFTPIGIRDAWIATSAGTEGCAPVRA